jgi:hypothetical protein
MEYLIKSILQFFDFMLMLIDSCAREQKIKSIISQIYAKEVVTTATTCLQCRVRERQPIRQCAIRAPFARTLPMCRKINIRINAKAHKLSVRT